MDESVALARADILNLPHQTELVVLAFDGAVTIQDSKSEAIIVQAQRRGTSQSHNYAQRYQRKGQHISPFGNALGLGDGDSLF